ncbi:hypothetical protein Tco_0198741, partial [Tanacetum coccineum]
MTQEKTRRLTRNQVSIHGIGVSIAEVVKVAGNVLSTEDIGLRFSRE